MATEQTDAPITFHSFILSLVTTAAVHFGDMPDPLTGQKREPDLTAASQMIEILGMLGEKTRGNLTDDEQRLLSQVLYELRMRFVAATRDQKRIIVP
jgi:Domain of unknown function (DUF1844)